MRNLTTFILFLLAFAANARQISPDEAAAIASDFLNSSSLQLTKAKRIGVKRARAKSDTEDKFTSPYYVFNGEGNQGFVIISGDDRAKKILGYSDAGSFDFDNLPPQLAAMLDQYAEQIASLPESAAADPSWSAPPRDASTEEGKLLETANWGQGYPYNAQCPVIDGVQCPTGCVATAMAIVMKYHNWPEHTNGKEVTNFYHKNIIVDFNNSYINWGNLKENSDKFTNEVSRLMLLTGTSVHSHYEISGSGASMDGISHELITTFGYNSKCCYLRRKFYDDQEWRLLIDEQLNNGLPIIYGSTIENTWQGHTYVLDGKAGEMYHINWGWDGDCNGFFDLDFLKPTNDNYSDHQSMIINIKPDLNPTSQYSPLHIVYGWNTNFRTGQINSTTSEVHRNEIVTFTGPVLSFPNNFHGWVNYALIDENDNIVELATPYFYDNKPSTETDTNIIPENFIPAPSTDEGWRLDSGIGIFPIEAYTLSDFCRSFAFTESNILPSHRIILVSKEDSDKKWKQVLGLNGTLNYVPTKGINSQWAEVEWIYDSDLIGIKHFEPHIVGESLSRILRYQDYKSFNLIYKVGNSKVFINDILIDNLDFSDDYLGEFYEKIENEYPRLIFPSDLPKYKIKIDFTPDSEVGIIATNIYLKQDNVTLAVGESVALTAVFSPKGTSNKTLIWTSSDETIAVVDQSGNVTAQSEGECVITATATDGSGVSASCRVTVRKPAKGDSNANGTVNIADAVNTANYAVGIEVENFCFEAADVNEDNRITLSDASGTVTILLESPVEEAVPAMFKVSDKSVADVRDGLVIDDYVAMADRSSSVFVSLDNTTDYVALQADVTVPEGMTLNTVKPGKRIGAGHSLMTRRVDERTMRIALFNPNNVPFANNDEPILELVVKGNNTHSGDIEIRNIIASDAKAGEYRLLSMGGHCLGTTAIGAGKGDGIGIGTGGKAIHIHNAQGQEIAIYSVDGRMVSRFTATSGHESRRVDAGLYIVAVGNETFTLIVK